MFPIAKMAEVKQVEPLEKARLERKVPQTKLWDHFCSRCPADLVVRFESKEDVNRHLVEWLVNPDFFLLHFLFRCDLHRIPCMVPPIPEANQECNISRD